MQSIRRAARLVAAMALAVVGSGAAVGADERAVPLVSPASPAGGTGYVPAAPPACSSFTSPSNNGTFQALADNGTITSTIEVAGLGPYLWDVNVLTTIEHTASGDLELYLVSPAGTRVSLSTRNGGANDDVFAGTVWDDQADFADGAGASSDNIVTEYAFVNAVTAASLSPEEPLGAFQGESANGHWHLVINDVITGNTGSLVNWTLELTALNQTPIESNNGTQVYNTPQSIPDTHYFLLGINNPYAGHLGRVEVTTNITATDSGDVLARIISPAGITTTLTNEANTDDDNVFFGTEWHDSAGDTNPPGAVTDNVLADFESPLAPKEGLAKFNSSNPQGTWYLQIQDMTQNSEKVGLTEYSLTLHYLSCQPDLYLTQSSQMDFPIVDAPLEYRIKVENQAMTATSVILTDTLPVGATFLSLDAPDWNCQTPAVGVGGTVQCSRSSLGALLLGPDALPLTLTVQTANLPGPITNTVTISSAEADKQPDNNTIFEEDLTYWRAANGAVWDVQDENSRPDNLAALGDGGSGSGGDVYTDSGMVNDGGQDAFDDWGGLIVVVQDGGGAELDHSEILNDFDLIPDVGRHWTTFNPQTVAGVSVSRQLYAPAGENYLRYVDTFANTTGQTRVVYVAWGGNLGSDGYTTLADTSSGDLALNTADTWGLTIENIDLNPDGPAGDPPVGYALRTLTDSTYLGPAVFDSSVITETYAITAVEDLAHIFRLTLAPGASASLAYFVVLGLAEDGAGPEDCEWLENCTEPEPGEQMALVTAVLDSLSAAPDFCDLSLAEMALIVNWPGHAAGCGQQLFLPMILK